MASCKALVLAGIASLLVTSAHGADLLSTPSFPPPPPPVPSYGGGGLSGFYLRGDVGIGIADINQKTSTFVPNYFVPDLRNETLSFDDQPFVDAGVGYRINEYLRVDATGEYRAASNFSANESYNIGYFFQTPPNARAYDHYSGNVRSVVGLVNGYVDVGTLYGVTPFFGAGVGVADVKFGAITDQSYGSTDQFGRGNGGGGYSYAHSQTNFAFALMAGLDFRVTPNLTLEFGYRYLDLGKVSGGAITCTGPDCGYEVQHFHVAYHDVRLGARYMFADILPRQPVIARY